MSWLDDYRQAKFRSAYFYVSNAENSSGRRSAVHEFPKQDTPYVEDMGRKARTHRIEAYILGEDYFSIRDELQQALEKEGPGKLVHPYLGTLDVICTDYSFRESIRETRMARFTITFAEAGLLKFPSATVDATADVARKKSSALDRVKSALEKVYSIASVPYSLSQNAINTIDNGLSVIEDAKKSVSAVSDFRRDIENMKGKVIQLAYDVTDLAQEFVDAMTFGTNEDDSFEATAENSRDQLREMTDMFEFEPEDSISDGEPASHFAEFIQRNAVINAMGLMSIIEFDSLDEAVEFRTIVFDKAEEILLDVDDDDFYTSLYDLKTAVTRDLDTRILELARLVEYTLNASLPAVMVSHDLYANIDEEQDIIERNNVEHPLFVPGGVPLEVRIYA